MILPSNAESSNGSKVVVTAEAKLGEEYARLSFMVNFLKNATNNTRKIN